MEDRYELLRVLGEGGEARVLLARDRVLGREVAIKRFHPRPDPDRDGRLTQIEARVAAGLNHYALTTLLDAGVEQGRGGTSVHMVMEYVPGESLAERLVRGPITASEAGWLGFDLAEGLDYMHQSGFLHRDVKPANILISGLRSVRPVVAKLTDFGIAAPIGEPDLSEFTVGTAAYLSPEQVEGRDAERASDVYSLGLVLLEAVTGERAYPGGIEESAFARLVEDPRIPASLPAGLVEVLRGMTARRPEDRMDLHRVAVDLQQFLVDDLLQRRGPAAAAPLPPPPPEPGTAEPSPVVPGILELAARCLGAPAALLLRPGGADGAVVVAQHGEAPAWVVARIRSFSARWGTAPAVVLFEDADAPGSGGTPRRIALVPVPARGGAGDRLCIVHEDAREVPESQTEILAGLAALLGSDTDLRAAMRSALFGQG